MATTINLGKVVPTAEGLYDATVTYAKLSIVTYEGSSYISKVACAGVTPGTNDSVWVLIAQGGTIFTYDDLTEEQKAEIAQPAYEQAQNAAQYLATIQQAIAQLDPSTSTDDAITALAAQLSSLQVDALYYEEGTQTFDEF